MDAPDQNKRDFALKLQKRVTDFFERIEDQGRISPECRSAFLTELNNCYLELLVENDALRRATHDLKIARDHYHLYYDLNPVACFSLNYQGLILEANLTASKLLNVDRHNLRDQQHSFTAHLSPDSYETFFTHVERTLGDDQQKTCLLNILRIGAKDSVRARLHSRRIKRISGDWECLTFVHPETPANAEGSPASPVLLDV